MYINNVNLSYMFLRTGYWFFTLPFWLISCPIFTFDFGRVVVYFNALFLAVAVALVVVFYVKMAREAARDMGVEMSV